MKQAALQIKLYNTQAGTVHFFAEDIAKSVQQLQPHFWSEEQVQAYIARPDTVRIGDSKEDLPDLDEMKKGEVIDYAVARGVQFNKRDKKADIITAIKEQLK